MEKFLSVIALAFALSLAGCNPPANVPSVSPSPTVVEAPRAETPTPPRVETPASPAPTTTAPASKKRSKTYTQTPRLDALAARVTALENKIKFYEQQFLR